MLRNVAILVIVSRTRGSQLPSGAGRLQTNNESMPPSVQGPQQPRWHLVLFGLAYLLCAGAGLFLSSKTFPFVTFWLPGGLLVATLLRNSTSRWPAFLAVAVAANLTFDLMNGKGIGVALLFATGNCLEGLTGAWLVRRFVTRQPTLASVREVVGLVGLSALLSTMVSATLGSFTVVTLLGGGSFWSVFPLWWSGDMLGVLLLAPLILSWDNSVHWWGFLRRNLRRTELGVFLLLLIGVAIYVFYDPWHPNISLKFLAMPFLLWAVFRHSVRMVAATSLLLAGIATWFTAHGLSDIAWQGLSPSDQVASLQVFIGVLVLTGLFLAATLAERRQTEVMLNQSRSQYRDLVETSQDLIWQCDCDGRYTYLNPAWTEVLGYKVEEMLGRCFQEFQAGEQGAKDRAVFAGLLAEGVLKGYETVHRTKDGRQRTLVFNAKVVRDEQGRPAGTRGTAYDISDRKRDELQLRRSLEDKEVLLREVHHRVKNNLQVVSSLLELQGTVTTDPAAIRAMKECQGRIRSIALVHAKLYQSVSFTRIDFKAYVHDLVAHLFHGHTRSGAGVRFELEMPESTVVPLEVAVPCGMLINELVTNSLKHAFWPSGPGTTKVIRLRWEETSAKVRLTVADNGCGLAIPPTIAQPTTLGLRLANLLARQLSGELRFEPGAGCTAVLEFPFSPCPQESSSLTTN